MLGLKFHNNTNFQSLEVVDRGSVERVKVSQSDIQKAYPVILMACKLLNYIEASGNVAIMFVTSFKSNDYITYVKTIIKPIV